MIGFIVSIMMLLLLVWLILPHLRDYSSVDRVIVVFLAVCADIILVLEIAGLTGLLKFPLVILGIQLIILLGLFFFNKHRGIKVSLETIRFKMPAFPGIVPVIFLVLIVIIYAFLLFVQFRFPQSTSDSLYNHLSRIGFWLQQGSLDHYFSFTDVGTTFPYNNSLLMMWPVAFLRSDAMAGLVQFAAAIILALTIYAAGLEFGYSKKGSFLVALFFLTFPIIALESITAQNDLLVAAFLLAAFYFLLKFSNVPRTGYLILSLLAYALAIGTKQHALFALPGYAVFFVWVLIKNRLEYKKILKTAVITTVVSVFLFGSYAYIQNWIVLGSPVGSKIFTGGDHAQTSGTLLQKAAINSARLFTQFISCDGLPPAWELKCIAVKTTVLRPVIRNIESPAFLLEADEPFSLDRQYLLNEESTWFGIQSWIVILPVLLIAIVISIKKKKPAIILFIVTALIYWVWTSAVKPGWDPYVGRYLIFAIALLTPFTASIFGSSKWCVKLITILVMVLGIFTLGYSILNNDSRPLTSRTQLFNLEVWGKDHSTLVQKVAYKLSPLTRHEYDVWSADEITLKTWSWGLFRPVLYSVEEHIPENAVLVILAPESMFPDYLLFGQSFGRTLIELTEVSALKDITSPSYYLLAAPGFDVASLNAYVLIDKVNGWSIYKR